MSDTARIVKIAPEPGDCFVCGQHTTCVALDISIQKTVGRCCVAALRSAELALSEHGPKAGICHPSVTLP